MLTAPFAPKGHFFASVLLDDRKAVPDTFLKLRSATIHLSVVCVGDTCGARSIRQYLLAPHKAVNFANSPSHRQMVLASSEVLAYDLLSVQLRFQLVSRERSVTASPFEALLHLPLAAQGFKTADFD